MGYPILRRLQHTMIDRLKTKPINNFNTTADRIICRNKEPAAKWGGA